MDRMVDRLNEQTPDAQRCVWPGCRHPLQYMFKGHWTNDRIGLLCYSHAADVAVAVVEQEIARKQFESLMSDRRAERMERIERAREISKQFEAETAELRGDRPGFVYYLRVGERIKVGFSTDVKRRMRQYPPGSDLLAVEPGDLALERQRHQQFSGSKTDGREWFSPTEDLMQHARDLVLIHGEPKRYAHHYRKNQQPMRLSRRA